MMCCDIWESFDEANNLLKEYTHRKLLLRNRVKTLGNCVIITKRHIESLSDITPEEMAEFAIVAKDVEKSLGASFGFDKMNYQMLMMKEKHVHFHAISRYAAPKNFAGIERPDAGWPLLPPANRSDITLETLQLVKQEILTHL